MKDLKNLTLNELVAIEAKALRKHLFKAEKARLDIKKLDADNSDNCIYGLTTGSCWSKRAQRLIMKCVPLMISTCSEYRSRVEDSINGKPKNEMFKAKKNLVVDHLRGYFTPIENYILINKVVGNDGIDGYEKNGHLIAYLKGEVDTLEL